MQIPLFAMLVLAAWAQGQVNERRLPERPARPVAFTIGVGGVNNGRGHTVTLTMPEQSAAADDNDDQPPERPVVPLNLNEAVVERENFDRWLFAKEESAEKRQRHLEAILRKKVEAAVLAHKLTDKQTAKLRLAGRGDVKRLFDAVEDKRREFERDRQNLGTGLAAFRRLEKLSQAYKDGPFGDGSLFAKTLNGINADQ